MSEYPEPGTGRSRLARWIADRAAARDRVAFDTERIGDIRWRWRQACQYSGLGRQMYGPTGPSMSVPPIGRVELGPPTWFTVLVQPGQLPSDFEAAAPRIAAAMRVAGIRIRPLAGEWIVVELHDQPPAAPGAGWAEVVDLAAWRRRRRVGSAAA